jgi:hypothetical protein
VNINILSSQLIDPTEKSRDFVYKIIGDSKNFNLKEVQNLYSLIKNSNINDIQNFHQEFILLIEDSENIFILTDSFGLIKKFYTVKDNKLYFGTLWGVVQATDHDGVNFDYKTIYEQFNYARSFNNKSIIKDVAITNSFQVIEFSKKSGKISIKDYRNYERTNVYEHLSELEIIEQFEENIEKQIIYFEENSVSNDFLVSLSGGLDSRIIIPFLKKHDRTINTFHIGVNKSYLNTYDQYLVRKLLKNENITFNLINPFKTKLEEKINLDIFRNPTVNSNILKAIKIEDYPILNKSKTYVSGSHGGAVGGRILDKDFLLIKNTDDLKQYIENKLTLRNESFVDWKEIVGSDYDPVRSELGNLKQKYNNNLDIFMHFHKIRHTNLGVYESLLGQIDFYSIYVPFIWLNSLNWDFKYLENRSMLIKILKKLGGKYLYTPMQNSRFILNDSQMKLFYQKLNRKIRTSSIDYGIWWNNYKIKEFALDSLGYDSSFYNVFDKKKINNVFKSNTYSQSKENILKLISLYSFVENKAYKTKDEFQISSKY